MRQGAIVVSLLWSVTVAVVSGKPQEAGGSRLCLAVYCEEQLSTTATRRAAARLAEFLKRRGYAVRLVNAREVSDPQVMRPERFQALLLPDAAVFPTSAAGPLDRFLRGGGHLVVVGGPPFKEPARLYQRRWWTRTAVQKALREVRPTQWVFQFDKMHRLEGWRRATNRPWSAGTLELVERSGARGKCLHYKAAEVTEWDTWYSPPLQQLAPAGGWLLCFNARADENTPQVVVEVRERDGSRWMAVVKLGKKWRRVVLTERDFEYWYDSVTGRRRGGRGDRVHFDRAVVINFGLARSHAKVPRGKHEFWIDDIGVAPNPLAELEVTPSRFPTIETLYPPYKTFQLDRATHMRLTGLANAASSAPSRLLPLPHPAFSCIARPRGMGFFRRRKWRWIPLVEAADEAGNRRGTVLWLLLNCEGPYARSALVCCGVTAGAVAADDWLKEQLVRALDRLSRGLFLLQAGASAFTVYEDQSVRFGAEAVNFGTTEAEVRFDFLLVSLNKQAPRRRQATETLVVKAHKSVRLEARGLSPLQLAPGAYRVVVELRAGGEVVDRVEHDLHVLRVRKPASHEFVRLVGNRFVRNGKSWNPIGVNYWPLYVSGLEPADFTASWLKSPYYDPVEIERDLELMDELGVNMVSVQLGGTESAPNLIDFLRRCGEHNILVFGFLSGASPLRFNETAVRAVLSAARLVDNAVLFAYDIIWEPGTWVFRADRRGLWNRDWTEWVKERYGSIKEAEADWGFRARRDKDGFLADPTERQMREDGPWRVMVAAYRRFMDDLMSAKWNAAVRRLRRLDPNHLISFRQGNTLPQDFTFTATPKHIDFICPEGYAIPHSEHGYNAACFITRYVKFTTRGKPVLWAEFGRSVWDRAAGKPNTGAYAEQADYHELFYRACVDSGATGTAPWWWPGGYRVNERSDYGIIDPDGTPRPAAMLIRDYAKRLKARRPLERPIEWFTIDRDAHPGGYWYVVFNEGAAAWAQAKSKGRMLEVRSPGTGTTSINTPKVAVGNRPYNGRNPPKYLDAEFNYLQILDAGGVWREAFDGAVIRVKPSRPVLVRASIGNIQEAVWIAPRVKQSGESNLPASGKPSPRKGTVWLATTEKSEIQTRIPIPCDTPYLSDAEIGEQVLVERLEGEAVVELQMTALGRMWFGEKRTFRLDPKP